MIMVLAGTKDGRILAERLFERGLPVLATTVTEYGSRLFQAGIYLRTGPFNKEDFRQVIYKNNIELIIDATHPYARDISEIAIAVSGECKVKYLRYERENTLQEYANIIHAKDLDEAIRIDIELDRRIFTPIDRASYKWARCYKKRTSVERVNSRLDTSFCFENHHIRGIKKMKMRCSIALAVMLAMAVGRIRQNQADKIRSLVKSA
jgi:precorrin-6x reductase